jgi:aspartyl protease family protein
MTGDIIASLFYFGLLLTALVGYVFFSSRQRLGKLVQQAVIWVLIFVGVIGAYGLWPDISRNLVPRQTVFDADARVEIPIARDGHYYLTLTINGQPVEFVVDTGASDIVLTARDAARIGFQAADLDFNGSASTANGIVQTARIELDDVRLGGIRDRGLTAVVNGGSLDTSLLGMSYLNLWQDVRLGGNQMVMRR